MVERVVRPAPTRFEPDRQVDAPGVVRVALHPPPSPGRDRTTTASATESGAPTKPPVLTAHGHRVGADDRALTMRPRPPQPAVPVAPPQRATPDVHVTIGRVEIRAVPAATPQRPTRRAAPRPLSLDDYLAERNRRSRA